jgi:multisubunit Na+/H+ antiporter MnhB subunit
MTTILTQTVARLLLPPSLMVAAAVLVKGYVDVGDGFSAGVIAALGVLIQYLAFGRTRAELIAPPPLVRRLAWLGLLLALLVVFVPALAGKPLLNHFPAPGGRVIHLGKLELHTAVVFDVGVFLLVFGFAGAVINQLARQAAARPDAQPDERGEES